MRTDYVCRFCSAAEYNGQIYYADKGWNLIWKMNLESKNVEFVDKMMLSSAEDTKTFRRNTIIYNNKLIMTSQKGLVIHTYDLDDGTQKEFQPYSESEKVTEKWISEIVPVEDELFIIPLKYGKPLYKLNLNDGIFMKEEWFNEWREYSLDSKRDMFTRFVFQGDGVVWTVAVGTNKLVKIDFCRKKISSYEVGVNNLFGVYESSNGFWVNTMQGEDIYHLDFEGTVTEHVIAGSTSNERMYNQLIEVGDNLVMLPYKTNQINVYNIRKRKIESLELPRELEFEKSYKAARFLGYEKLENGNILINNFASDNSVMIRKDDMGAELISMKVEAGRNLLIVKERIKELLKKQNLSGLICSENSDVKLEDFIESLI